MQSKCATVYWYSIKQLHYCAPRVQGLRTVTWTWFRCTPRTAPARAACPKPARVSTRQPPSPSSSIPASPTLSTIMRSKFEKCSFILCVWIYHIRVVVPFRVSLPHPDLKQPRQRLNHMFSVQVLLSPQTRDGSLNLMRIQKANNAISHISTVMQYKTVLKKTIKTPKYAIPH